MRTVDPVPFMGMPSGLVEVRLSQVERETLRRATVVLEALRERRLVVSAPNDDDTLGVDIAMAAYTCQQLADDGKADA